MECRVAGREGGDGLGRGRSKPVDGLGVVADRGHPATARSQQLDQIGLQGVDILVLVDQHAVEQSGQRPAAHLGGGERPGQQQQIVEVAEPLGPLAGRVGNEDGTDGFEILAAPRKGAGQHVRQAELGIGHPAQDGGEGLLAGKAVARLASRGPGRGGPIR